jgi:iron complex transport system substrate-binding protein
MKNYFLILGLLLFFSCNEKKINSESKPLEVKDGISVAYANGFSIKKYKTYTLLTVNNPWQNSDKSFRYILYKKKEDLPNNLEADGFIQVPIKKVVVTSTTHIPSLEMLEVEKSLVGFPNLSYISSPKTRQLIKLNNIIELGKNEAINTETLLELQPDVVIGFGVSGSNPALEKVKNLGIQVVYNGDWIENSPLAKAEWIKFFSVFYGKEKQADSIFKTIERDYNQAKDLALQATHIPAVISGALYKDVWYAPAGNSWGAQFLADANANYIFKETKGTGSLQLSLESILDKGKKAQFWIGPGYAKNLIELQKSHPVYAQFDAFKTKKVYGFTNKTGETGGVLYYELGPNRPDLILKDLIKILHPELLPDYTLFFFNKFE